MRTKITIAVVIVIIIGIIAIIVVGVRNSAHQPSDMSAAGSASSVGSETINPSASDATSTSADSIASSTKTYSLAQVGLHGDGTSCWTAINGKVYDVTSWINQHPGGPDAILSICGKDGSVSFNGQHGGQARPEAELATFYIGVLTH